MLLTRSSFILRVAVLFQGKELRSSEAGVSADSSEKHDKEQVEIEPNVSDSDDNVCLTQSQASRKVSSLELKLSALEEENDCLRQQVTLLEKELDWLRSSAREKSVVRAACEAECNSPRIVIEETMVLNGER